jgi:GT2 family glycosyltransferase
VEALTKAADERPDAGLLACKILSFDGRAVQYHGARFNALLGYSGRVATTGPHVVHDVGRVDGAGVVASRRAVEQAGLLDEALFMYAEDVDWSLRVRAAGFAVVIVPGARVRHKGSGSSGGRTSTTNLYYSTRNTIVVSERHAPLPRGLRALRRGVVVGTHLAQAATHPTRVATMRAVVDGWRAARSGRTGPR